VLTINNSKLVVNSKMKIDVSGQALPFSLDTIATYLRDNISDLKNPSFFSYNLDGNSYSINDGGNDMFDGGNFTAPWFIAGTNYSGNLSSIPTADCINYANITLTNMDTNFNYITLGYGTSPDRRPLTVIGSRTVTGAPVGFQKAGNIGADGGGSIVYGDVYTGETINGFTVHAYYRQTYGQAADPAICDVYILLGHSNWGSVFGTINKFTNTSTQYQGAYFYTSGAAVYNILGIATLLSRASPTAIPLTDVQTVVTTYTAKIKTALNY